jgi:hypothetical protein
VDTVLATAALASVELGLIGRASGPHAPGTLSELEGGQALAKAVNTEGGEQEVHLDVLVCEDQTLILSAEEHLVGGGIVHKTKAEGFILGFICTSELVPDHIESHVLVGILLVNELIRDGEAV